MKFWMRSTCAGLALSVYGFNAAAQDAAPAEGSTRALETIVVTTQKRAESLEDIPIAITALGAASLERNQVENFIDLNGLIPNAQFSGSLGINSVFLRGIGTAALGIGPDASIAFHNNGVYIARPRVQAAAFMDVERIEVVRGPQGDLYGRNATGGSINVISRSPGEEVEANASVSYGNYNTVAVRGGVGGPLSEGVRARIAGIYKSNNGFGENIATGNPVDHTDEHGVRGALSFDLLDDRLTLDVIGDYYRADDSIGGWHYFGQGNPAVPLVATSPAFGGVIASDIRDIASDRDASRDFRAYGGAATLTYEATDSITLRSITGYRESDLLYMSDLSGGTELGVFIDNSEEQTQLSQEIQMLVDGDRWNLILGGYYFNEKIDGFSRAPLFFFPGATFLQIGTGETDAYAAFANFSYDITDQIKVIAGLRYSYEERFADGTFTVGAGGPFPTGGMADWDSVTPRVVVEYQPNSDLLLYASVSKGFKSGGWLIGATGPVTNPEILWSYEVGAKVTAFDGRAQANFAAFYYDYSDLVVSRVVGPNLILENAAEATNLGVELELAAAVTDQLTVNATFGYLNAEYDEYSTANPVFLADGVQDLAGNKLSSAPEFTYRIGADYTVPLNTGDLTLSADFAGQSEVFFTPFNEAAASQGAYGILNARLKYTTPDERWSVSVFGRNLTDKTVILNNIISAGFLGFPRLGTLNDPRTYGVEIGFNY